MIARVANRRTHRGFTLIQVVTTLVAVSLAAAVGVYVVKIDKHKWGLPHADAPRLLASLPECPENWTSFPLFPDSLVKLRPGASERYFSISDGVVYYNPPSGLPLAGSTTSIPEFNDCQKFIRKDDPSKFDSLYAIFAAFQVDSVTSHLGWHHVNWTSSNSAVATVDASGYVTAVATGNATIIAHSQENPNLQKALALAVTPGPPSPNYLPSVEIGTTPNLSLPVGASQLVVAEFGDHSVAPRSVATIYTYGPGYSPLGIGPNFSCLFVGFDASDHLRARMVPTNVQSAPATLCTDQIDPEDPRGKDLEVRRTVVHIPNVNQDSLYPAVARWDYDPSTQKHFIGIACGQGWCEIGEGPFNPPRLPPVATATAPKELKVLLVKGWHDQQFLAVKRENELVPSNLLGTVIPNPDLKSQPWSQNGPAGWHLAAYVTLQDLSGSADNADRTKYQDFLNLREIPFGTPLATTNKLSYCYGTKQECVQNPELLVQECDDFFERVFFAVHRWWVRIDAAGGSSKILCVTRRMHPDHSASIIATARWRWILKDDSIWSECVNGCCQTGGGT